MGNSSFITYDIIIKDEEFGNAAKDVAALSKHLDTALENYKSCFDNVIDNAISSGKVHDAMVVYMSYVGRLIRIVSDIGLKFNSLTNSFLSEVGSADHYLYDAGITHDLTRDYSKKEYEHLLSCLDDPWSSITDSFGDWVTSNILKVINLIDKVGYVKSLLQKWHRYLLDYNDETKAGLRTMFESIIEIDRKYGVNTSQSNTGATSYGNYDCIINSLTSAQNTLYEMVLLLDPAKGLFTSGSIKSRLDPLFSGLMIDYENVMNIPDRNSMPDISQVNKFITQTWAKSYFAPFFAASSMFLGDIGGLQEAQRIIFSLFDVSKTVLIEGDYEKYLLKKQLMSVLEDMSSSNLYSGSEYEETLNDYKTILKYYKKYGKKLYRYLNNGRLPDGTKILDGRTREAKQFRDFLESLGDAKTILSYGEEGIEFLARLLADYSTGIDLLNSFERNYQDDPKMQECLGEIKALYTKEFSAWANEFLKKASDLGIDAVIDLASDSNPVLLVVNAIDKGISTVGDLTGLGSQAKAMTDAISLFNLQCSINTAYMNAVEKLRIADPNSDDYQMLVDDVINCFNLNKKNLVEMFKAMAKGSTGVKQSYYTYCASQAQNLSMYDSSQPSILTYEQFLALNSTP